MPRDWTEITEWDHRFIEDNLLTMTDHAIARALGLSLGQVRWIRRQLNLNRPLKWGSVLSGKRSACENCQRSVAVTSVHKIDCCLPCSEKLLARALRNKRRIPSDDSTQAKRPAKEKR